jgi:DNA invertase Pin-like site-specific DNA recombinase
MADQQLDAVDYSRVSDDSKRRDARSVTEQAKDNLADIRRNGWRHADSYSDNDVSASRFGTQERPDWNRLRADLDNDSKVFDVIVLWETSRGDRTADTWLQFLSACRKRGTLIHVTSHSTTYDVRKPRQWKILATDGIDNAYASEETSLRVKRDMKASAEAGRPHGSAPYGYRRVYDAETGVMETQVPEEPAAGIVREIISRVAEGEAVSAITKSLNRRGIPSPRGKQWACYPVRRIATNRAYIAQRIWPGERAPLPGIWEPIIDPPDVFWDAQAVLEARHNPATRSGRASHLLSWLAICGKCGQRLVYKGNARGPASRGTAVRPVYSCPAGCAAMIAEWLDTYVTTRIITRLSHPDLFGQLTAGGNDEAAHARATAAELRSRHAEAAQSAARGTLSITALEAIENVLLPDIEAADRKVAALTVPPLIRGIVGHPRDQVAEEWAGMPIAAQRDISRVLLEHIKLMPAVGAARSGHAFDPDRIQMRWTGDDEDS